MSNILLNLNCKKYLVIMCLNLGRISKVKILILKIILQGEWQRVLK